MMTHVSKIQYTFQYFHIIAMFFVLFLILFSVLLVSVTLVYCKYLQETSKVVHLCDLLCICILFMYLHSYNACFIIVLIMIIFIVWPHVSHMHNFYVVLCFVTSLLSCYDFLNSFLSTYIFKVFFGLLPLFHPFTLFLVLQDLLCLSCFV